MSTPPVLKVPTDPSQLPPALAALIGASGANSVQPNLALPDVQTDPGTADLESHVHGAPVAPIGSVEDLQNRAANTPDSMSSAVAARSATEKENNPSFLTKLGRVAGGFFGMSDPNNPNSESRLGGVLNRAVGGLGDAMTSIGGTPQERQLVVQRKEAEANRLMGAAKLAEEQNYHQGMIGTRSQANDIKEQKNTSDMLAKGYVPDANDPSGFRPLSEQEIMADPTLSAKWKQSMASTGLKDAETDKIRDMLLGQFPVDATTAALSNRPDLAGHAVGSQMWQQMQRVIATKGYHVQDLGQEGMWVLDKAGNRFHKIADVGPSIGRAQAYAMFRAVPAVDPQTGEATYMTAGDAVKAHAAPAGIAAQQMSKEAQFRDIYSGIGMVRSAVNDMRPEPLDTPTIAKLTMAMRETDPTIANQVFDTVLGSQNLTPEQQNFVVAVQQLNERALSLRNVAGMGNGSDQMRAAIRAALPSVKSGNPEMMRKQLDALTNMVDQLHTGIVKVRSPQQPGSVPSAPNAQSDMVKVQIPGQPAGQIHRSQLAAFKTKYPNAVEVQ